MLLQKQSQRLVVLREEVHLRESEFKTLDWKSGLEYDHSLLKETLLAEAQHQRPCYR